MTYNEDLMKAILRNILGNLIFSDIIQTNVEVGKVRVWIERAINSILTEYNLLNEKETK